MKSEIELYVIGKVKEKREEKGLSQVQFADLVGLSFGFIGKAESPKYPTKYNLNHLNKFAIVLGCSPSDFLPSKPFPNDK